MASPKPQTPQAPLPTKSNIQSASTLINPYIHRTPLLTCATLNRLASTPISPSSPSPKFSLFLKAESLQKIGAFKARGAFHALLRLIERLGLPTVQARGVVTHSSGNHAQALALASSTLGVKCTIVMPTISTKSKIAGTRVYCQDVRFSGSTSVEREEVVRQVIEESGAILIPPYDDFDIIAGQGTVALEMEEQYNAMRLSEEFAKKTTDEQANAKIKLMKTKDKEEFNKSMDGWFETFKAQSQNGVMPQAKPQDDQPSQPTNNKPRAMCSEAIARSPSTSTALSTHTLDGIIAPLGGGGLLGGIASYFRSSSPDRPLIFGAEPSFSGANDAELGLRSGSRVEHVSSLTIADGLRTPVGILNWDIISDPSKVAGVYSVTESQIKDAMRLVFERMKLVVEPSGCVGLAAVLYNEEFRRMVAERQRREGTGTWDMGIVFSGGNTTMEAIVGLYGGEEKGREEGTVGRDGKAEVEDVAG